MSDCVLTSRSGDVATVILNRPDKLNAMNLAMWQAVGRTMQTLSADDTLRCIVLRGAGREAFAAGADIGAFATERANRTQARTYGEAMVGTMSAIGQCRHPTVALIQGVCVGGGLELACMCDLRICGASSRFGIPVKRLGLVMGYEELQGLLRVVGPSIALEILLEGRVFDANEALAKGLVTRVVPDDAVEDEAYAAARRIADGAPLVARWHKQFIRRLSDPATLSSDELDESYACFATEDFQTGIRAFLDKTTPVFKGK